MLDCFLRKQVSVPQGAERVVNAPNEIRLWSVRPWEMVFWPANMAVVLVGSVVHAIWLAAEKDWAGAAFYALAAVLLWRFGRIVTVRIGVTPEEILVRRALGSRVERISTQDVSRCVMQPGGKGLILYQQKRWLPPAWIVSQGKIPIGYPSAAWVELTAEVRRVFEPQRKWEERPWWRPAHPL